MTNTEKIEKQTSTKLFDVKNITQIGMLSAIAVILMLFEFPLWFAPGSYKMDFSEIPVLLGSFAIGPVAGVLIELIKVLLNLAFNGTITGGVGEMANFFIGCSFVVPAAIIYKHHKSKKNALIGLTVGTIVLIIVGSFMNAYLLLPMYANVLKLPLDTLIKFGTAVNPAITDLRTYVIFAVAPFNLFKGVIISIITMLIYKKISPILHGNFHKI